MARLVLSRLLKFEWILEQYVTSIGEVHRFDVVLHVDSRLFDTLKNTTAVYKRMLTASRDFSCKGLAVRVLGREYVARRERAGEIVICTDEGLGSRLVVSSVL